MTPYHSKLGSDEFRYPAPARRAHGYLTVSSSPRHDVYYEEYGDPDGEPVLVVHGGPGGGCEPSMARYFDPQRYRVVLFDQRGCGKSVPSAASDPEHALLDNTTRHLIDDMLRLRVHLNISGTMHLFGGSWGSTLALAFAIAQPETVRTLVLRGIFLCRRKDVDFFYQGNAARYASDPYDTSLPGTYQCYPEAWRAFVEVIEPAHRHDMVKAYAEIFARTPLTPEQEDLQTRAAVAWSVWEGSTSYLAQDLSQIARFAEPTFAKAFARIENHYFMNGAFLGGSGEANRTQSFLLENVARIAHIPVHIVHGRYDLVCPMVQAEELVAALLAAGAARPEYRLTAAGHSMRERENYHALVDIMAGLPR
jgi:proline iminopeptidase